MFINLLEQKQRVVQDLRIRFEAVQHAYDKYRAKRGMSDIVFEQGFEAVGRCTKRCFDLGDSRSDCRNALAACDVLSHMLDNLLLVLEEDEDSSVSEEGTLVDD
ncbi:hypothetical protein HY967_03360 [Candidatus Jorgensenbacteria bacterium]|nr:hypothetical protein [Candidatus Jorgensenbacteria bacterium]